MLRLFAGGWRAGALQKWGSGVARARQPLPGLTALSNHAFFYPEVSENTWRGSLAPRSGGPKRQPGAHAIGPEFPPTLEHSPAPSTKPLLSAPMENRESTLDAQRPPGDPDRGFLEGGRLRKVQTFPRLPPESPETRALCLTLASTKSQQPAPKPTPPDPRKELPEGTDGLCSFKAQPKAGPRLELQPKPQQARARGASHSEDRGAGASGQSPTKESPPLPSEAPQDADPRTPRADKGIPEGAGELENAATEQVSARAFRGVGEPAGSNSCSMLVIYYKEGSLSLHTCLMICKF